MQQQRWRWLRFSYAVGSRLPPTISPFRGCLDPTVVTMVRRYSPSPDEGMLQPGGGGGLGDAAADYGRGGLVMGSHGIPETVEAAKVKNLFHDSVFHRCSLCDEQIGNWQGHIVFVPHQARLGIVERILTGQVGPPEQCVERWWRYLDEDRGDATFFRIHGMSHAAQEERRKRIVYLLAFLVEKKVLRHSLCVWDPKAKQFARSTEFERLEMIGDNIVKCVVQDRMHVAFPPEDGGLGAKLNWIQQLIDSNEGLLRLFDYLTLDKIIGQQLAQSKFKSDVVECLFGEIQVFLWACSDPVNTMTAEFDLPNMYPGFGSARALMQHLLFELTDVVLMYALESTVNNAMKILKANYNPVLEKQRRGRGGSGRQGGQRAASSAALSSADHHASSSSSSGGGKYHLRPSLTDIPLPASASATSNANVVVLRGANVEAKLRQQAAQRHLLVQPCFDFTAHPRSAVPSAVCGADAIWPETRRQRAMRLDSVWQRPLSLAAQSDIDSTLASRQPTASVLTLAAVELSAELNDMVWVYERRVEDAMMQLQRSLDALAGSLQQRTAYAASAARRMALRRQRSTTVQQRNDASQPWLRRRWSWAADFSPMRPDLSPGPVASVLPPLTPTTEATEGGDDSFIDDQWMPHREASCEAIAELTSWPDSTGAHPYTWRSLARRRCAAILTPVLSYRTSSEGVPCLTPRPQPRPTGCLSPTVHPDCCTAVEWPS